MEKNIQELTEKMFRDGVEKGNEEAARIVAAANAQAAEIVEAARKEAEALVTAAQKSAAELMENTKSELRLFAGQAVNALKSEVATLVSDKVVGNAVKELTADKEVMGKFVVTLAEKWVADEPIVISAADGETLKK